MTTLRSIIAAARAGASSLVGETAGYLVLGAADAALAGPIVASMDRLSLTLEGSVRVERSGGDLDDCELALRRLLGELLAAVRLPAPNLALVAQTSAPRGISSLVRELEAALVPVNRTAAKRALSRLARDTERAFERDPNLSSLVVEEAPPRALGLEFVAESQELTASEEPPTPELPASTLAPSGSLEAIEVDVEFSEDFGGSVVEAPDPLESESRDERYLAEENVLEAMLAMRPAHRDTAWADEDDFLTELWAARSVRPPQASFLESAPPTATDGGAELSETEESRGRPTLAADSGPADVLTTDFPADEAPRGADLSKETTPRDDVPAPSSALRRFDFDAQTMVPMPVEVRPREGILEVRVASSPNDEVRRGEPTLPAPRRTLADFESPEPPILVAPRPWEPLGPFELPDAETGSGSALRRKAPAAAVLAPIVLRVDDAPETVPSGPLLDLGAPEPRRRSDITGLLGARPADVRPSADLLATLQSLSGLGAPRVPSDLVVLAEPRTGSPRR